MRAWAWLALLVLAPGASAGLRITEVAAPDDPIAPETELAQVAITAEADCASVLLRRLPGTSSGVPLYVNWTGENMALGTRQELVDPAPCLEGATVIPIASALEAAVLRGAPAMVPQEGQILLAFAASPLDERDPSNASAPFTLRASPLVVPEAIFGPRQATLGDVPVTFTVQVRNLGNVAFDVAGGGTFQDIEQAGTVAVVDVAGARVERGGVGDITVTVGVPQGAWSQAHAAGALTFTSALGPGGTPREIPFDFLLVREGREANQAPPAAWPLALVALAALAARRR